MSQTQASQTAAAEWCARTQAKLMAALDAAWALAERSDDPATIAKVREKAKTCGLVAATARKIAAMVPMPKVKVAPVPEPDSDLEKPPAAQAVAMRAALRKMGRR